VVKNPTLIKDVMKQLLAIFLLALSTSSFAGAVEQLKQFTSTTNSAKGNFAQVTKGGKGNKTAAGMFEFAKPGKFIWEYRLPFEQTLQSDGVTLFIYDKDLNQLTKKSAKQTASNSPAMILFGNDITKSYNLSEDISNDGLEWVRVLPKVNDGMIEMVRVAMKNNMPVIMQIQDVFDNTIIINFYQIQRNITFSADHFNFTPPKGTGILN
jgi:outer membrane lipoprotein carrier protein